jgi:hypothetical protein
MYPHLPPPPARAGAGPWAPGWDRPRPRPRSRSRLRTFRTVTWIVTSALLPIALVVAICAGSVWMAATALDPYAWGGGRCPPPAGSTTSPPTTSTVAAGQGS